jgi:mRNA-degrading endonuclease RelE of RelBE toxin-antitoxin system
MYAVRFRPTAALELRAIRVFDRARILGDIGKHLTVRPLSMEGAKKRLDLDDGDFVFQLRVGAYRIFYDVNEDSREVVIRHIRRKARKTTGEIL